MKALIKIAGLSKILPRTENMVTVSSLLNKADKSRIKSESIGSIAVMVGNEAFFLSEMHKVPSEAIVQRDGQGLIIGLKAVAGG